MKKGKTKKIIIGIIIGVGKTILDCESLTLSIGDEIITLPQKEFLLL